jgi:glutathione S-transferase
MKRFRYMKAVSVREAIGILAAEPGAALMAGGTNLVDLMKYDVSTPTVVVDINGLPLHDITEQPDGLEGFAAVMEGVRYASERLKGRAIAGSYDYDQIPALVERGRLRVKNFYADLDARLAALPFVAGDHFSAADITGLVTVDFATKAMSLPVPDEHKTLRRWVEKVSSRPSVAT